MTENQNSEGWYLVYYLSGFRGVFYSDRYIPPTQQNFITSTGVDGPFQTKQAAIDHGETQEKHNQTYKGELEMTENLTCDQRIDAELESTLETLRLMWEAYQNEDDEEYELENGMTVQAFTYDIGELSEYGLDFSLIDPSDYDEDDEGNHYWCWLLSTGGPHSEFRFYLDRYGNRCYCVEFVFKDWGNYSEKCLTGDDKAFMDELWEGYLSCFAVDPEPERHSDDTPTDVLVRRFIDVQRELGLR